MATQSPSSDSNAKLMALLAYVIAPIGGIIILLMDTMKNDPVLRKHAVQSIAFSVPIIILSVVLSFVFIGVCIGLIGWIIQVYWGIQAYQGKDVTIPVVTDFCKKQKWF